MENNNNVLFTSSGVIFTIAIKPVYQGRSIATSMIKRGSFTVEKIWLMARKRKQWKKRPYLRSICTVFLVVPICGKGATKISPIYRVYVKSPTRLIPCLLPNMVHRNKTIENSHGGNAKWNRSVQCFHFVSQCCWVVKTILENCLCVWLMRTFPCFSKHQ